MPPELLSTVPVLLSEAALAERKSSHVLLETLIGVDGSVKQARVIEAAGPEIDRAVLDAVLLYRFSPATRDGEPTPAKIHYRYELEPPANATNLGVKGAEQGVTSAGEQAAAANPGGESAQVEGAAEKPQPPSIPPDAAARPAEVVVQGRARADRIRESARAVDVVEMRPASKRGGDLGDVLARTHGISVRRVGGLGSTTTFSLNGLSGDQVRVFVDGIPADLAGYPLGLANLPLGFVEWVEVYRGVLPIGLGADALGGAINVVTTDDQRRSRAAASYQGGSFDTHRMSGALDWVEPTTGAFARANAFFDATANDYLVEGDVLDDSGRVAKAEVRRFHDAYRAFGANVEAGVQGKAWARQLLVRGFYTANDKELQHNALMTVPYGEANYRRRSAGSLIRYHNGFGRLHLESAVGYTWNGTEFDDVSECRYDWYGRCVQIPLGGELNPIAMQLRTERHTLFSRNVATWILSGDQLLRAAAAPTLASQTGRNLRIDPGEYDPATARRQQLNLHTGVEYELQAWEKRLTNIVFAKNYLLSSDTEEELPNGNLRDLAETRHRLGGGDSLRLWLLPELYTKASYEWATRLPNPEEMFGNGALIVDNLHILPESSHNLNLGLYADLDRDAQEGVSAEVNGFARWSDQQIVLLSSGTYFQYENVLSSRSLGVEGGARWTSPARYVTLGGNATWQDVVNTSEQGPFAQFQGDRIPNRPYLFANAELRLRAPGLATGRDALEFIWDARYTHEFFRSWESVGATEFKATVPTQLLHTAALVYTVRGEGADISSSIELSNITDEQAYDYWGVQRPGRAVAFKLALIAPGENNDP